MSPFAHHPALFLIHSGMAVGGSTSGPGGVIVSLGKLGPISIIAEPIPA